MASFIPAPKTVKCAQLFTDADGHTAQCRFYIQYGGTMGIPADYTAVAGALQTTIAANLMPLLHDSWISDISTATDLSSDTSPEGEVPGGTVGSLAGGRLPGSTALVVSQQTARRFRGGHSRVYLPVGDDTKLVDDAHWTGAFVTVVDAAWQTVVGDTMAGFWASSGTKTAVMASFYSGFTNVPYGVPTKYRRTPTGRAAAVNFAVTNYVGKAAIGTQRRRIRP
jgi:hypothetical protein